MALGVVQLEILKKRKQAAKSALRFFKDIKSVKSTNNPFARITDEDHANLYYYRRDPDTDDSVVQSFEDAAWFGVGNCEEKGRMCYASLVGNPLIPAPASNVTLCSANDFGYDHVFVVVADVPITGRSQLKALPITTMIVDGWTEDWYFPQLPWTQAKYYNLGNTPNPRQLYVRMQIAKHAFARKGGADGPIEGIGGRGVVYNV